MIDPANIPEWVVPVLSVILSMLSSQILRAVIPPKYWAILGPARGFIELVLDILGGNWGYAKSATQEQIEQQKADASAKKAVRKFGKPGKK